MKFFEKRGVALVVLALAIAGAVFIGQSRKDGFIAKKPTELLDVQYQDWICDEAGLLNGQTEQLIRDYNDSWNSKYYAITAVASIDHLTGWDAEDYAANLGEKWGLGRNDMILLLVKDGDWQVYCGDNVGYTMTDTQQNQLRQAIETTYYSGDFDSAVTAFFRQADVFYAQAKLDGGNSNKSIVETTLEVIDRMGLTADECRMLEDGNVAIWFKGIYDRYTQYRRDHAILGECLPYGQFMKQLRKSDLYVCDRTVMLGDNRRKGTILDYGTLKRRCDVDGFLQAQIEPLRSSCNQ